MEKAPPPVVAVAATVADQRGLLIAEIVKTEKKYIQTLEGEGAMLGCLCSPPSVRK